MYNNTNTYLQHMPEVIACEKTNTGSKIVIVSYISLLLFTYAFNRFVPGIRFSQIVYFDPFRIGILIGAYLILARAGLHWMSEIHLSFIKQDKLFLLFYLSLVISYIWSFDRFATIRQTYNIFYLMLFYVILLIILRKKDTLLSMYYYFLFAPFVYFFISYFVFSSYGTLRVSKFLQSQHYFVGSFSDYVSASAEISIPFLYSLIIAGKTKLKVIAVLSLFAVILVTFISETRGSLIAIVFMTVLYFSIFLFKWGLRAKLYLLIGIFILLCVIFTRLPFHDDILGKFIDRFNMITVSMQEPRYELYSVGIKLIKEKWLLGWGYGSHASISGSKYFLAGGRGSGSHNFIITIWSGAGIFSLFVFFYLIVHISKRFTQVVLAKDLVADTNNLFVVSAYISLISIILHGMVRPMLDNTSLYFLFALTSIIERIFPSKRLVEGLT